MPMPLQLDPALLSRLEALRLSVRHLRWGQHLGGRFLINRRGSSIEFADYVPYAAGDDIRSIDWRLYARLNRLYVKTYKEEIELAVELLVDATASMGLPSPEKFRRACEIALALSYIGLAGRHRVRVSGLAPGGLAASPWHFHRAEIRRIAGSLDGLAASGRIELPAWTSRAIAALRIRGGQAILISDWMYRPAEVFQALQLWLRRHVELKLIQVVSPLELDPARLVEGGMVVDAETGATHELAYRPEELTQAVLEHQELLARFCKRQGILFAQHRLDEPLEEFLLSTLPARGFVQ